MHDVLRMYFTHRHNYKPLNTSQIESYLGVNVFVHSFIASYYECQIELGDGTKEETNLEKNTIQYEFAVFPWNNIDDIQ